jgi:hypothetical protein
MLKLASKFNRFAENSMPKNSTLNIIGRTRKDPRLINVKNKLEELSARLNPIYRSKMIESYPGVGFNLKIIVRTAEDRNNFEYVFTPKFDISDPDKISKITNTFIKEIETAVKDHLKSSIAPEHGFVEGGDFINLLYLGMAKPPDTSLFDFEPFIDNLYTAIDKKTILNKLYQAYNAEKKESDKELVHMNIDLINDPKNGINIKATFNYQEDKRASFAKILLDIKNNIIKKMNEVKYNKSVGAKYNGWITYRAK